MYKLVGVRHNPPVISSAEEEESFQSERRECYRQIVALLSSFGNEGDYYGVSDFAVRPDLLDRQTVTAPPAAHVRQYIITILSETFFQSAFLNPLRNFLQTEAPEYRILIDQDFDPEWSLTIFLTADLARVYCTDPIRLANISEVLAAL